MAKQQTRTSGGAYQNPTEGIVDYGAFNKGLQAGLKPGLDFLKEQEKEKKALDEEAEKIQLDTNVEVFGGVNKNKMTGGVDLITNDLFTDDARFAMSSLRSQYIDAFKKKDKGRMNAILMQIGDVKNSYSNLSRYIRRIGDNEVNDGVVSNTRFIDENKEQIEFNGADFTNLNNNSPNAIRKGSKTDKYGKIKQGFYVISGGKEMFLNTQDMDEAYLNRNFKLKDNLQASINESVGTKGITSTFNRTPDYNTDNNTTITVKDANGKTITTNVKDSTKYITNGFYSRAETAANTFALNKYSTDDEAFFESGWSQFTKDKEFVLSEDLQKDLGDKNYRDPKVAAGLDDNLKIKIMQDYAAEKWKISIANKGYVKGDDGRALKLNQVTYSEGRTTTRKPNEPSNNEKNIALNIKNGLTGNITAIKNNLFSVPVNVTFSQVTTKGVNFKNNKGTEFEAALSKDFTGGKTLKGIQFTVKNLLDGEGKEMADTDVNYDFSLLKKSDVGESDKLSLEHYLIDKHPGSEAIIREQIEAEADRRKNYWITNVYKSNPDNEDKSEDEALTAYRLALKQQLRPN